MFVVYDLETTGLSTTADDVVQFSYIRFDNNNMPVQAETLYFYYEGMHWSEEAEQVHGISMEECAAHADVFEANLCKMYSVLSFSNVIGFNSNKFDNPFAKNYLARAGIGNLRFGIQKDVMLLARPVVHKARISLINLCEHLGITPDMIRAFESACYKQEGTRAHSASYDVAATALCALSFMRSGYFSWAVGATDINPDQDVFGNVMNPPEDPNGFWCLYDGIYHWLSTNNAKYVGKDPCVELPDGIPFIEPVIVSKSPQLVLDFSICQLYYDNNGDMHVKFPYGDYLTSDIPFDKLRDQLTRR